MCIECFWLVVFTPHIFNVVEKVKASLFLYDDCFSSVVFGRQ